MKRAPEIQENRVRHPFRLAGNGGFTLLEVLVALIILSLVSAALAFSLRTALDAGSRARQMADRLQEVRIVFAAMERDLRAAYLVGKPAQPPSENAPPVVPEASNQPEGSANAPAVPAQPQERPEAEPSTWFVGEPGAGGAATSAARLGFTALSHRTSFGESPEAQPQADLCAVEYTLGTEKSTGRYGLLRRERVPPQITSAQGVREQLISDRVADIRFRYDDGEEWRADWNTDTGESKLPARVEVTLTFVFPGSGRTVRYQTALPLLGEADAPDIPDAPAAENTPAANTPPAENAPQEGNMPPAANTPVGP
ncbi:MAG: prepilin-type N-terminal cleavage/methylation domain-containing protein [Armatimonadetes bacterium]|nr:prepilin-type N-terminal cleavage/methylation domain-containing protein [Armatimonadota bacterium]